MNVFTEVVFENMLFIASLSCKERRNLLRASSLNKGKKSLGADPGYDVDAEQRLQDICIGKLSYERGKVHARDGILDLATLKHYNFFYY